MVVDGATTTRSRPGQARPRVRQAPPRRRRGLFGLISSPIGYAVTLAVILVIAAFIFKVAGGGSTNGASPAATTLPTTPLALTTPGVTATVGTPAPVVPHPLGSGAAGPLLSAHVRTQASSCTGYKTYGVPTVAKLDFSKTYTAIFTTNKGTFSAVLDARAAPVTVQSFIFLADHHYFDGVSFHRVVPGFVAQGGDPTGSGLCGPGYAFGDENLGHKYVRGSLAMANSGPGTNGSQFFVVLQDQTNGLDRQPIYNLFGQVAGGYAAIDAIAGVKLGPGSDGQKSKPLEKVYMKTVRVVVS